METLDILERITENKALSLMTSLGLIGVGLGLAIYILKK